MRGARAYARVSDAGIHFPHHVGVWGVSPILLDTKRSNKKY